MSENLVGRLSSEMFFIDRQDRRSLQMQLTTSIVTTILEARAQPGTRMPSTRQLAEHLGVSRLTVTLVYQDLVAQGYLDSLPRSGFAVSQKVPHRRIGREDALSFSQPVDWGRWLKQDLTARRRIAKPLNWRSYPYPFLYGQADPTLFDHAAWRDCARRALGAREFTDLADERMAVDDPILVDFICRNTLPRRGIRARPEEVLITLGAQNGIWLAVQLLARKDRVAVMEDPGFPDFAATFQFAEMQIQYVPCTAEGLEPASLPPDTGLVAVTPSHSIPTGATMPLQKRRELLTLADKHDFLIIEDDYEFEMSFLEPPSPALKSLDGGGRVIYIGSFSKALFPGLRIGYVVGPERFIEQARALRAMMLRHAPGHMQRVTGYFLALGHYDAHIVRLRETFRRRREVLTDALEKTEFRIAGAARHGGSSLWIEAPGGVDSAEFAARLADRGVLIEHGRPFFSNPPDPCPFFRVGFSSISEEKIEAGIKIMHQTLASDLADAPGGAG
ncbi:PLP-dependent aminotransferase family protein [Sedimentimonas flavescens]|uniref:PLP-dependent aminotransferase family protein n=1 Tax=Sedimentimonas flavescens TaxID=2851012 RepID=A0ABT3A2T7_9RHOB|nr:PLP-dependent aminotransferase family protein [Sedimentimonas flavescens]MCV2880331.1 PLP-dependent aminotransferase family protein [Sedimentimonas flavescens]